MAASFLPSSDYSWEISCGLQLTAAIMRAPALDRECAYLMSISLRGNSERQTKKEEMTEPFVPFVPLGNLAVRSMLGLLSADAH